nr:MAG TPA: antitoxin [Caudoviricetes sp.]
MILTVSAKTLAALCGISLNSGLKRLLCQMVNKRFV